MMTWKCREFKITKYDNREDYENNRISSIEIHHGNLITNNGLKAMWILATGGGTINVDGEDKTVHPFTTTNSKIAIGKGSIAATSSDTKLRMMYDDGLLPISEILISSDSDGVSTITFKAEAGAGVCAGEWSEWGIYESYETDKPGILFNRKAENMGTKSNTSIWKIEIKIDLNTSN